MNREERAALRLAARMLESGVDLADGSAPAASGHVALAVALARRLRPLAADPQRTGQIVASLRAAADDPAAAPPLPA